MSDTWLVGIDDTDNLESIGTGRLSRMLAEALVEEGLLRDTSVTRHQFLVHPDIPYTSHNSSACIEGRASGASGDALLEVARAFLQKHFHDGANPGLCVSRCDAVPAPLLGLARRAQREVLDLADFDRQVASLGLALWSDGETGQGRLGASCGVALRASGEDGRYIALRGIRDLCGTMPVRDLLARSAVEAVASEAGELLGPDVLVDTRDWVRPTLRGGRPVWQVRREGRAWVPAERRQKDA